MVCEQGARFGACIKQRHGSYCAVGLFLFENFCYHQLGALLIMFAAVLDQKKNHIKGRNRLSFMLFV
jgi:hypothetical protein